MWNIEALTGYKPLTTFWDDFSIADRFGLQAITDTYTRAFNEWKSDYKYLTKLVMVLNWKSWQHADNQPYCELYAELYYKAHNWACHNLEGDEFSYYFRITD